MLLLFATSAGRADAEAPPRRRVSPTRATLESLVLPGLGQVRAGDTVRGLAIFGLESYLVARVVIEDRRAREDRDRAAASSGAERLEDQAGAAMHESRRSDLLFWTAVAHMYNLLDAYVAAHLSTVDEEIDDVQRITLRVEPRPSGGDIAVSWAF